MAWEVFRKKQMVHCPFPMVSFGKTHISFNAEALNRIGETMKYVIVMTDEELGKVGFWFFKDVNAGMKDVGDTRKLRFHQGQGRLMSIGTKCLVMVKWMKTLLLNKPPSERKFLLEREPNDEYGKDFFVTNLRGNSNKSGFEAEEKEKEVEEKSE